MKTRAQQQQQEERAKIELREQQAQSQSNICNLLRRSELVGLSSKNRKCLQQSHLGQQLACLTPTHFNPAQSGNPDKAFCSVWLNHSNVLVGTKCNKLIKVHIPTGTQTVLQYPQLSIYRHGPDLLASSRVNCGQHGLAISPCGQFVVTGGRSPEDILLWDLAADSNSQQRGSVQLGLQPLRTFMGHADWVFGLHWVSPTQFVSAGRDRAIKLWQVPSEVAGQIHPAATEYSNEPLPSQVSVLYHKDKVRAIAFDEQQQHVVALAIDGSVSWWTPDLRLKGSCVVPNGDEAASLAVQGNTVVAGSNLIASILDVRAPPRNSRQASSRPAKRPLPAGNDTSESRAAGLLGQLAVRRRLNQTAMAGAAAGGVSAATAARLGQLTSDKRDVPHARGAAETLCYKERAVVRWQRREALVLQQRHDAEQEHLQDWLQHQRLTAAEQKRYLIALRRQQRTAQQNLAHRHEQALLELAWEHGRRQCQKGIYYLEDKYYAETRAGSTDEYSEDDDGGDPEPPGPAATQQRAPHLPGQLRYLIQRAREPRRQDTSTFYQQSTQAAVYANTAAAAARGVWDLGMWREQACELQVGPANAVVPPIPTRGEPWLEVRLQGQIGGGRDASSYASAVRSVSLHQHLLAIGLGSGGDVFLHDMRKLGSRPLQYPRESMWRSSWGLLPERVGRLQLQPVELVPDPVLAAHGIHLTYTSDLAVNTHCWDPTGTKVFLAGGAQLTGYRGCSMSLYQ